jgi:hypothetical protein
METAHKWLMTDLRRDHCIGDVLEKRATKLLGIGAPYNKETSLDVLENWFNVSSCISLLQTIFSSFLPD